MKEPDEYYEGKGCKCYAYSEHECCCDVDWTDPEVYELREQVKRYAEMSYGLLCGDTVPVDILWSMLRKDLFIDENDEWFEDDS